MRLTSGAAVVCLMCGGGVLADAVGQGGQGVEAPKAPRVNAAQVRPALMAWRIGTNQPKGPDDMVEAVTRATFQDKPVWRVTHYAADPVASRTNEFDLYDLDPETLAPIRSVMRTPDFLLELAFTPELVTYRRTAEGKTAEERIPLSGPVMPEGPGLEVFVASLPLAVGYTTQYHTVDRWSGKDAGRVKTLTLSVVGRRQMETPMGMQDAFEVQIGPADKSFSIVKQVRAEAPHYSLRVEYVRGKFRLVSEVFALAIQR